METLVERSAPCLRPPHCPPPRQGWALGEDESAAGLAPGAEPADRHTHHLHPSQHPRLRSPGWRPFPLPLPLG